MQKNDFPALSLADARNLPIRTIDFSDTAEKKLHDKIVALVDVMLDLNKKIQTARGNEKDQLQSQIDKTDREIDDLVYKLYGITGTEKKIIEEGLKWNGTLCQLPFFCIRNSKDITVELKYKK